MIRCYIAGPMRNVPYFNFPAFDKAKAVIAGMGLLPVSPADLDRDVGFEAMTLPPDYDWSNPGDFDFEACVTRDIDALRKCQAIYMLDGWENSKGAKAEKALAEWLGLQVLYETKSTGETRITDPDTGAQKGSKLARYDLIPVRPLWQLAEHYGKGSLKYADRNYEKGYKWSLSYAAAMRHANQFWGGEDVDPESGSLHVIAAAWHFIALAEFIKTHPEKDDRVKS